MAPTDTSRLFVAVWPPAQCVAAVAALRQSAGTDGDDGSIRWEPQGLDHVTLRFVGAADAGAVAEALGAARLPAARAVLGPAVTRLGQSVLCVPVDGLDELAGAVVAATAHLGEPPTHRQFFGHLTIGRVRSGDGGPVVAQPIAAAFEVTEVALVRSHLPTAQQPQRRYETVATFTVGGHRP